MSQIPISSYADAVVAPPGKSISSTDTTSRKRKRDDFPKVIISANNAPKPSKTSALQDLPAAHLDDLRTPEAERSSRDGCDHATATRSIKTNPQPSKAHSSPRAILSPCTSDRKSALNKEKKIKKAPREGKETKASRKQAVRAVKTLPSVEQLLELPRRSLPSNPAARQSGSVWCPSKAASDKESVALSRVPRSSPHRRSCSTPRARTELATNQSASSSPSIAPLRRRSMSVVKRETISEPLQHSCSERASMRPRSPSLSIFDPLIRQHKLGENGFVEQPEYEHPLLEQVEAAKEMQAKKALRDYIEAEKEAQTKKALWKEQERRAKNKKHSKPSDQDRGQSLPPKGKRKAGFDDEDRELRKRGRSAITELKVEEPNGDGIPVNDSKHPCTSLARESTEIESALAPSTKPVERKETHVQASKELSSNAESRTSSDKPSSNNDLGVPERSSEGASKSPNAHAQDEQPSKTTSGCSTGHRSGASVNQSSAKRVGGSAKQHHHQKGETRTLPGLQVWRKYYARREVVVPNRKEACVCDSLPDYFQRRDRVSLASWGAGKAEFMAHVEQINQCPGHSSSLITSCRSVLAEERRVANATSKPDDSLESALDFAQSYLSPESLPPNHPRQHIPNQKERAQSSIAPPNFYGSRRTRKNRSTKSPHKKKSPPTTNPFEKSENRPKQRPSSCRNNLSTTTPPPSSPLQNFGQAVNSTELQSAHQGPAGESPTPAGALSGSFVSSRPLQEISANIKRMRHQSMPANPTCRTQRVSQGGDVSSASRVVRNRMLERMPIQDGLLVGSKEEFARILKDVLAEHMPQPSRATDHQSDSTNSASANNLQESQPQVRTTRRMTMAQRKVQWPEFSRHVPLRDRLSDEDLINVGKTVNPYQRHCAAPYAFSWGGTLYTEYDRILNHLSPKETRRIMKTRTPGA